jgi:hypothetical protein
LGPPVPFASWKEVVSADRSFSNFVVATLLNPGIPGDKPAPMGSARTYSAFALGEQGNAPARRTRVRRYTRPGAAIRTIEGQLAEAKTARLKDKIAILGVQPMIQAIRARPRSIPDHCAPASHASTVFGDHVVVKSIDK